MSKPLNLHTANGVYVIASAPGVGIACAFGPAAPSDNTPGFAPNCLFIDTNGTAPDASLYINVGTLALCNFDPLNLTI